MLPITDNRPDYEKRLSEIEPSGFFIWGDDVYRRIESSMDADIRYKGEGIPCVHQSSGELSLIGRDAWVVPCSCELYVVG